jgi:type IV pilus assembly protein PilE
MRAHKTKGFTLIELMIVVAILAILAAFAYSNYSRYGFRARRTEGQQYLMQIAAAEERYFTAFNQYTATLTAGGLGFTGNTSTNAYYTVTATVAAPFTSYTLTAAPGGSQAADQCGNLILNSVGTKSSATPTTNGSCW